MMKRRFNIGTPLLKVFSPESLEVCDKVRMDIELILLGMDFIGLLRSTSMGEERPLPENYDEIPPELAIHAGDIASLLIGTILRLET